MQQNGLKLVNKITNARKYKGIISSPYIGYVHVLA